ncbi:MAG: hypothetical protein U0746_15805 [Gemmataceae bacterium]
MTIRRTSRVALAAALALAMGCAEKPKTIPPPDSNPELPRAVGSGGGGKAKTPPPAAKAD